ncbi:MAG: hypothetical protein VW270_11315 [Candidatus Poseidoniales archaeon]
MIAVLKKMLKIDMAKNTPMLKYRESQYTLAELERRLTAEINGYGTRY